jgi:hypothetical protein
MIKSRYLAIAFCTAAMLAVPAANNMSWAASKTPATITSPPSGKGQVVFYRTGGLIGAAISCNVREDGKLVGGLSGGKYFVSVFEPGKHVFTTKSEAKDTLNMEIESNETYYVRCAIGAGVMAGRPNLSPVDKAAFDEKSGGLKFKNADQIAKEVAKDSMK